MKRSMLVFLYGLGIVPTLHLMFCNVDQCPTIKERLEHHVEVNHSTTQPDTSENGDQNYKGAENMNPEEVLNRHSTVTEGTYSETHVQATVISPQTLDTDREIEDHKVSCMLCSNSAQSVSVGDNFMFETSKFKELDRPSQANCKNDDDSKTESFYNIVPVSHNYEKYTESPDFKEFFDPIEQNSKSLMNVSESRESIKLERKKTVEILAPKNIFYKDHVKDEVHMWVKDLPMNLNLIDSAMNLKECIIELLIDEICNMRGKVNEEIYEEKLRIEISKCLERLSIWISNLEYNQLFHKENYIVALLERIKKLNIYLENKVRKNNTKNKVNFEETQTYKYRSDLEIEIIDWLGKIKWNKEITKSIHLEMIVDLFINHLSHVLQKRNNNRMYKLILKGKIFELLLDLPISIKCPKNKMVYFNKLASELANSLLSRSGKFFSPKNYTHHRNQNVIVKQSNKRYFGYALNGNDLEIKIDEIIVNILRDTDIVNDRKLKEGVTNIIIENIDQIHCGNSRNVEEIIRNIMYDCTDITANKAAELAETIVTNIKYIIQDDVLNEHFSNMFIKTRLSGLLSVYNTQKICELFSSTTIEEQKLDEPKEPSDIHILNPAENKNMDKLSTVIKDWMNTLQVSLENDDYKNTIIRDLSVNLASVIKHKEMVKDLNQSLSEYESENNQLTLKDIIHIWLNKINIFDNPEQCNQAIDDLYTRITETAVPSLTKPCNTYQEMSKTACSSDTQDCNTTCIFQKGIDILEKDISMWIDKQSDKFINKSHERDGMVKKLACGIQERLICTHPDEEIMNDIANWMSNVINPDKKELLPNLIEELNVKFEITPQDIKPYWYKYNDSHSMLRNKNNNASNISSIIDGDFADPKKTINEYIAIFIKTVCENDDPIARKVYSYILKKELIKICPSGRPNVCNKNKNDYIFSVEYFGKELEYIKILSDWLNTLPLDPNFNVLQNKDRIIFIHRIAKHCIKVEEEMIKFPNTMNYDTYLLSLIMYYVSELPIDQDKKPFVTKSVHSLFKKIKQIQHSSFKRYSNSLMSTEDLGKLINGLVQNNGHDIADDPLKAEVWLDRLSQEIKNIAAQTTNLTALEKTSIYNKLAKVPIPEDKIIPLFESELGYAKEVIDWLKNLSLEDDLNKSEEDKLIKMIVELSDRLIETRVIKLDNPTDPQSDRDIVKFIKKWIFQLPLKKRLDIVVPVVMQQLMNRINRVNMCKEQIDTSDLMQSTENGFQASKKGIKTKTSSKLKLFKRNPENAMIEAVETFCDTLPIQGNCANAIKTVKEDIAKRVLETICILNIDPSVFDDEFLYKGIFGNEIDILLESLALSAEEQNNSLLSKKSLIDTVVELNNIMKEQLAGETYKQKLENTIEASIPNPIHVFQVYDPGFELYKNRLATLFILENFDHAGVDIKAKYEKRIQADIDKYFKHATSRSAIPLSKDEIQNELYSDLFKVPKPKENSIHEEVEDAKTRFEIDAWYEQLPIQETNDLHELLERDKILSTLARRIHEIQKSDDNTEAKLHKEIIVWLNKLPLLLIGYKNIEELTNELQFRLKSSVEERKFVSQEESLTRKKDKGKPKSNVTVEKNKLEFLTENNKYHQPSILEKAVLPQKPAADLIIEAVTSWCTKICLLSDNTEEEANANIIRDSLAINIILKIGDINNDIEIFLDDCEYNTILDQEIERLIQNLPLLCDYECRHIMKIELIETIMSIKPLIVIEREQQEYKEKLKYAVRSLLEKSANTGEAKESQLPNELIEAIMNNFIELTYNKDDIDQKNVHKSKIQDAIEKHLSDNKFSLGTGVGVDSLIVCNELVCEMSKVVQPQESALTVMVEAMRFENEVNDFFKEFGFSKEHDFKMKLSQKLKCDLVVKLYNLEENGHDCANESIMNEEVAKCFEKLGKKVNPEVIETFIKKLRETEGFRKAPRPRKQADQSLPNHDPVKHKFSNLEHIPPFARQLSIQTVTSLRSAVFSHPLTFPITQQDDIGSDFSQRFGDRVDRSQVQAPQRSVFGSTVSTHPLKRNANVVQIPAGNWSIVQNQSNITEIQSDVATRSQQRRSAALTSPMRIQSPAQHTCPGVVLPPVQQVCQTPAMIQSPTNTSQTQRQVILLPIVSNSNQQPITQTHVLCSTMIPDQAQRELTQAVLTNIPYSAPVLECSTCKISPSTTKSIRFTNTVSVDHLRRPVQDSENYRARAQRDPGVDEYNERNVCKCNSRRERREKVCIRGRYFNELSYYPPPCMEVPEHFFC